MKSFLIHSIVLLFSALAALHATAKPNIIFILADDLGVGNVSCYGADNYRPPTRTSAPPWASVSRTAIGIRMLSRMLLLHDEDTRS